RLPIGGTMELLPLCNMNCKMCYIRLSKQQMETQGRMLSCDEWLRIAESAREAGVLFLMLTGGEPLMYPEFERLYLELTKMGFIMTMNTNATILDGRLADMFAEHPIRRLNITLYGADNAVYEKLCGNPNGFTQVMNAIRLLEERHLRFGFNYTITPENEHQVHEAFQIAREHQVQLDAADYMFPPMRKAGINVDRFTRLSPKESVEVRLKVLQELNPGMKLRDIAINLLRKSGKFDAEELSKLEGPNCTAGRSGFWINWKGELLPCGMLTTPQISLLGKSFKTCWEYITEETKKINRCKKCDECGYVGLCPSCSAACLTETGSTDGCPDYLCVRTKELLKKCTEILEASKGDFDL
ncbi:MAG: radical SAM protein, partial [Bacteroidaceae bacterium]|nr:radical SAM protein [Bacteroidaceae bacterium]